MGDRALIIFRDDHDISPTVYLHWEGHAVPDLIEQLSVLMTGRTGDASYAAARFIGLAHEYRPGNVSLGVFETPDEIRQAIVDDRLEALEAYSHGDAGAVLVSTDDFSWHAFGGYLENE